MKKYMALILSIIALAAIITAAYAVYSRYGGVAFSPPELGSPAPDRPAKNIRRETIPRKAAPATRKATPRRGSVGGGKTRNDRRRRQADGAGFPLKILTAGSACPDHRDKSSSLNFWATWCVYCGEEIRHFNALDRELQEAGDAVILAVNAEEPYDKVKEYIADNEIDLTVLLDEDGDVTTGIFGVVSFPNTFIINTDGSLYAYIPGLIGIDPMRELIDKARNGEPLHGAN